MESKTYEIVNLGTKIVCKSRVARLGDTVSTDEVLRPDHLEGLSKVGKIKEVVSAPKAKTKKTKAKKEKVEVKSDEAPKDSE